MCLELLFMQSKKYDVNFIAICNSIGPKKDTDFQLS